MRLAGSVEVVGIRPRNGVTVTRKAGRCRAVNINLIINLDWIALTAGQREVRPSAWLLPTLAVVRRSR